MTLAVESPPLEWHGEKWATCSHCGVTYAAEDVLTTAHPCLVCARCGELLREDELIEECGAGFQHMACVSPFEPCTLPGLADEWNRLNIEIHDKRKLRDSLEAILLEASAKDHNGASVEWREGASIKGKTVTVRAFWRLTSGAPHLQWEPKLEIVRP